MIFDLTGKRALITGASRGVGAGVARAFAAAGAHLVLVARNGDRLAALQAELRAAGADVEIHAVDVSTRVACRSLAEEVGEIDILVNNAALTVIAFQSILDVDDEIWDRSFAMNVSTPMALTRAFARGMADRRCGVVINISSVSAQRSVPMHAAYSASKAALEAMTRVAALDLAASNVRVVAVTLGLTATEALAEACADGVTPAMAAGLMPIGRLIDVGEIGHFCRYLASDEAAAMTGVVLNIDGGQTAGQFAAAGVFETRTAAPAG